MRFLFCLRLCFVSLDFSQRWRVRAKSRRPVLWRPRPGRCWPIITDRRRASKGNPQKNPTKLTKKRRGSLKTSKQQQQQTNKPTNKETDKKQTLPVTLLYDIRRAGFGTKPGETIHGTTTTTSASSHIYFFAARARAEKQQKKRKKRKETNRYTAIRFFFDPNKRAQSNASDHVYGSFFSRLFFLFFGPTDHHFPQRSIDISMILLLHGPC